MANTNEPGVSFRIEIGRTIADKPKPVPIDMPNAVCRTCLVFTGDKDMIQIFEQRYDIVRMNKWNERSSDGLAYRKTEMSFPGRRYEIKRAFMVEGENNIKRVFDVQPESLPAFAQ